MAIRRFLSNLMLILVLTLATSCGKWRKPIIIDNHITAPQYKDTSTILNDIDTFKISVPGCTTTVYKHYNTYRATQYTPADTQAIIHQPQSEVKEDGQAVRILKQFKSIIYCIFALIVMYILLQAYKIYSGKA
jgi:hypothetical protein